MTYLLLLYYNNVNNPDKDHSISSRCEFTSNLFEKANKRITIIRSCGRTNSEPISLIAL